MNRPRKPARPAVIRALAYVRVSTKRQAESGAGLTSQRQAVTAEIARRGWELQEVLEDDLSAKEGSDRPGFERALRMLDAGEADALVALKIDRVSRSVLDFASLVQRSERHGWQLVTLDVPLDPATPIGKATRSMLATFAQLERDFISQRTTEALAIKREQGVKMGRTRTVPAEVVARIRTERWAKASWATIADLLNADGIPGGQGGRWYPMTCKRIAEDTER